MNDDVMVTVLPRGVRLLDAPGRGLLLLPLDFRVLLGAGEEVELREVRVQQLETGRHLH